MTHIKMILISILVSGLLTACVSQQSVKPQVSRMEESRIEAPPRFLLDINEAADDVKVVLAALVNKMRGDIEQIDGIVFDPEGDNRITEINFLNQGFALNIIDISGFQAEKVSDEKAKAFIEGYFQFKDVIGRMASFYFLATYSLDPETLTVHSSVVIPMPSISPVLETYFVPRAAFNEMPMDEFASYTDLYLFTLMYAVPMTPTDEERRQYETRQGTSFMSSMTAGSTGNIQDDYFILVFCKSQISPESSLEMTISKTKGLGGKRIAEPVYLYWENWRVLIAGGKFNPHADSGNFYINVAYNIDPLSGTKPVLAGSFSNQKNFTGNRPKSLDLKVVTREQDVITPLDTGLGPLESGYIFLDPARKADAAEIQKQLKILGYYRTKVDGAFGKGSRKALKQFKIEYNLGEDDNWDILTQKTLFKDSGL